MPETKRPYRDQSGALAFQIPKYARIVEPAPFELLEVWMMGLTWLHFRGFPESMLKRGKIQSAIVSFCRLRGSGMLIVQNRDVYTLVSEKLNFRIVIANNKPRKI